GELRALSALARGAGGSPAWWGKPSAGGPPAPRARVSGPGGPAGRRGGHLFMDAIRAGRIVLAVAAILAAPARADRDEGVRAAVERGVAYLKSHQHADGTWFFGGRALDADHAVGVSALAGL